MAGSPERNPGGERLLTRCLWYPSCNSPLCPLDPDLNKRHPSTTVPLCYWYAKARKGIDVNEIPFPVRSRLMRYINRLHKLQAELKEQRYLTPIELHITP